MVGNSYSYSERKGTRLISWEYFHTVCKGLSLSIAKFNPDIVMGISRGGLYPGTLISNIIQKDFYPIRLTRRSNDAVKRKHPLWSIKPSEIVKGKKILIVDEVCDSGETLQMAKKETLGLGASEVRLAVLYAHKKTAGLPDYIGIVTDELVLNPWDREVLSGNGFVFHPEYRDALGQQKISFDQTFLLGIEPIKIAKG